MICIDDKKLNLVTPVAVKVLALKYNANFQH